jgi:hypothetical protein
MTRGPSLQQIKSLYQCRVPVSRRGAGESLDAALRPREESLVHRIGAAFRRSDVPTSFGRQANSGVSRKWKVFVF